MDAKQKNVTVFEIMETRSQQVVANFFDENYAKQCAAAIREQGFAVHVNERKRPLIFVVQDIIEFILQVKNREDDETAGGFNAKI